MADFTLPELGEQIESGDVLRVLVRAGDTLEKDQPVLELETDKATIEVPSPVAGIVKDIKVKAGDKVKVGQAILSYEEGHGGAASPKAADANAAPVNAAPPNAAPVKAAPANAAPANAAPVNAAPVNAAPVKDPTVGPAPQNPTPQQGDRGTNVVDISLGARPSAEAPAPETAPAPAAPSVRRTARELGVEIGDVQGTGPDRRISVEDVKAHVKQLVTRGADGGGGTAAVSLPDFTRWGSVERQPMRAVRRTIAGHLSVAWATIPHVTQFDLADITGLEELRKRYAKQVEAAGGNLTVTSIVVKVVAAALRVFPHFNASIDMAADEIIVKKYVNIGVAVDTDRGLLVPVVRDADQKNIARLSVEIAQLSEKARGRTISIEEMQGGCFSISNLGGIGGTYFTPIVNAPEVAILGISRARTEPFYEKASGQFVPRLMLPLALSYDHRAIDGADGIRFLRWVAQALEQPFLLALDG